MTLECHTTVLLHLQISWLQKSKIPCCLWVINSHHDWLNADRQLKCIQVLFPLFLGHHIYFLVDQNMPQPVQFKVLPLDRGQRKLLLLWTILGAPQQCHKSHPIATKRTGISNNLAHISSQFCCLMIFLWHTGWTTRSLSQSTLWLATGMDVNRNLLVGFKT